MPVKQSLFALLLASLCASGLHAQTSRSYFADRMLVGIHYGTDRDWEGARDRRFETADFWGPRAGISLNRWLYAGIQARIIRARNFETDWQRFYMAGLWARGYLLQPALPDSRNRLGVFLESGVLTGNYAFENKDFIEYYVRRAGRWYIPAILGAELRLIDSLTVEACLQGYYNDGKNWDQYGIAYVSLGLNYHWGK